MQLYAYSHLMRVGENRKVLERRIRQNGSAIRDFRTKAGMDRSDLAERVGIKYSHLANIENDCRSVSIEVLYRLANALTVNIRSILRNPPSTPEALDDLMYEEAREQAS
jgi:transcriptional regulator with XRE-family HTH domain